jgi:hypothetical protein
VVRAIVTVNAEGKVTNVKIASDPGHGFGALARQCGRRQRFTPGLDAMGKPATLTIVTNIRFRRR